MGLCNDCAFYTKQGTSMFDAFRNNFTGLNGCNDIGFCRIMTDSYGNPKKVKGLDTCNNFSPKNSPSNSGYDSYKGGCFLTSACVEYKGKSDDCEELTALRKFRDGYMKNSETNSELVKEYYKIAPEIVEKIKLSGKEEYYYNYIYSVVSKCVELIGKSKNEETLDEYKTMVEKLSAELLN